MKKKIIYIIGFIILLCLMLLIPKDHTIIFETSGSYADIRLYKVSQLKRYFLEKEIKAICKRYEHEFSLNIKDSLVSQLNRDKSIEKVNDLCILLRNGILFSRMTDGVYDITAAPLLKVWGFTDMIDPKIPGPDKLMDALNRIDYKKIKIHAKKIEIGKDQSVDPGAFSKGLLIDHIYDLLAKEKIECIVEIGGDMRVFSEDSRVFHVGIKDPRGSDILKILDLETTMAVATSGDYERCFEENGKRYHHLISAKTGMPVRYQTSVSVIAGNCLLADAQSTVFFLMGYDWVEKNKERFDFRKALFVDEKGNIRIIEKR